MQNIFKRLIVINTPYHNINYIDTDFNELIKITNVFNYKSSFNKYKITETEDRNKGLYGKFYDSLLIYQKSK